MSNTDSPYQGTERRQDRRRKTFDRRKTARFEPYNEDRRLSNGRRATDFDDSLWRIDS